MINLPLLLIVVIMINLEPFGKENYANLISWVDSEEMLMQFAGPAFTFPLTAEQLDLSLSDQNRTAFRVVLLATNTTIGHAEVYLKDHSAHIGRVLIGDQQFRGKGLGQQIIKLLLDFSFSHLNRSTVELNVFDWNISAIKCYEKCGFTINPDKKFERQVQGETWTGSNMQITQLQYEQYNLK
jgi:RimJ/RimL family protein N-acetyltransferase